MTTDLSDRYTAAQLGRLSGVGERTVRYYVREGLMDPPASRGRGAHFDNRHLSQLRRVRFLQEAGLDHEAIRQYGAQIEEALPRRGVSRRTWEAEWAGASLDISRIYQRLTAKRYVPETSVLTRVSVADGIHLLFDGTHRLPSPSKLGQAVSDLRAALGVGDLADGKRRSAR